MCLKSLLTIKSSNESFGNENQKDQKDKFQESVNQQLFMKQRSGWSQKAVFVKQTKSHQKQG